MAISSRLGASHGSDLKTVLHRSQQAPVILSQQTSKTSSDKFSILNRGSLEDFDVLEKLFFSCLQSADDKSALLCLDRLTHRFGSSNERVMALRGLYDEAITEDQSSLERYLEKKYDNILSQNPVNLPIIKRRIALLRSLSRPTDAISSLVQLLDATPTDGESWCELAELYQSQGLSSQATFCLEEALLIVPHAWNVHARLGEIQYIYANSLEGEGQHRQLHSAIRQFCRSVELCDDYSRGFYGLALATHRSLSSNVSETILGYPSLDKENLQRLHNLAIRGLEGILAAQYSLDAHRRDFEENELVAVRALLNSFSR
ncbi:hypothetical protein BJX70DRAFT_380634 [Aspergillus crustosus]